MVNRASCPRCREVELELVQAGPVRLDQCRQCGGVWFDAQGDELRLVLERGWGRVPDVLKRAGAIADASRDTPTDLNKPEPLPCPRCGSGMTSHWYADEVGTFVVDNCPLGHGVWLDSGELERAFLAQQAFARKLAEMERSGAIDAALARAEQGDKEPPDASQHGIWKSVSALRDAQKRR